MRKLQKPFHSRRILSRIRIKQQQQKRSSSSSGRRGCGLVLYTTSDETSSLEDGTTKNENENSAATALLRSVTFFGLEKCVEPSLLSDFLMELGASSCSITDHNANTPNEDPIFSEPNQDQEDEEAAAMILSDCATGQNVWKQCDVTAHFASSFHIPHILQIIQQTFHVQLYPQKNEQNQDDEQQNTFTKYKVGIVPDLDWVLKVQESWTPIVVTKTPFLLRFPWHNDTQVQMAWQTAQKQQLEAKVEEYLTPVQLSLEGGIAFGTGEHPTTRLCLRWIYKVMTQHQALSSSSSNHDTIYRFLDYGCGSGILGLAACALAKHHQHQQQHNNNKLTSPNFLSIGIDVDADAIQISNHNARTNGLNMRSYLPPEKPLLDDDDNAWRDAESDSLVWKAIHRKNNNCNNNPNNNNNNNNENTYESLPDIYNGPIYNVCVANILATPLKSLAPTIASMVQSPGGYLGLSGILRKDCEAVMNVYEQWFDNLHMEAIDHEWVLITGIRK